MVWIMEIEIKQEQLRINMKTRDWCKLPYPDHPKGCPNYGCVLRCPPQAPLIQNFINLNKTLYLIVVEFNFAQHISKMKSLHPNWSDRQARCCLYWQNSVNKELENACTLFKWSHPEMITTRCPEAMGVNVIATAQLAGIPIEVKPTTKVYKIALAGYPSDYLTGETK